MKLNRNTTTNGNNCDCDEDNSCGCSYPNNVDEQSFDFSPYHNLHDNKNNHQHDYKVCSCDDKGDCECLDEQ